MGIRVRTFTIPGNIKGFYTQKATGISTHFTSFGRWDQCQDVSDGDRTEDHPLDIIHSYHATSTTVAGDTGTYTVTNYPPTTFQSMYNPPISLTGEKTININSAIAKSHPGEPAVSIPNFLFELKDVPMMLKHAFGRARMLNEAAKTDRWQEAKQYLNSPKAKGEDWLNWHFGWKPLLSDLWSIYNISRAVRQRALMLEKWNRGYISRRFRIPDQHETVVAPLDTFDTNFGLRGTSVIHKTSRRWVVSRWRVQDRAYEAMSSNDNLRLYAAAMGLDIGLSQVWDAMPWSWLVDWFTGIGDVIHAKQNRMGIRFKSACSMIHKTQERTLTLNKTTGLTASGPLVSVKESKQRLLVAPSLFNIVGLNYLNPTQLGTLAALLVTKAEGSSRY